MLLVGVALFPYANITIIFGSAMDLRKILHSILRLFSFKNHATLWAQHRKSQKKNHANLPGLYPIFIWPPPEIGQPLPPPRTTTPTYM